MTRIHRLRLALPLLALAACTPAVRPAPSGDDAQEMIAEMQRSADAWNRNDLEGFLHPYLVGPQTTFVGQDVVHGYDAIRDFYRGSWWKSGSPPGTLAYHDIDVRPLGRDHALMVGHWMVTMRDTHQVRQGIFSLTWERTPRGWRIIHDHSS